MPREIITCIEFRAMRPHYQLLDRFDICRDVVRDVGLVEREICERVPTLVCWMERVGMGRRRDAREGLVGWLWLVAE